MSVPRVLRACLAASAVMVTVAPSVVAATGGTTGEPTYEGPGSASAEDAVSTYMNGLAAADLDAIVSSFAVETYVEHFDLRAYLERVGVYSMPANPLLVPTATPFTLALGVEQRHGSVVQQILFQYLALADPTFDPSLPVNLTDLAELDDFYGGLESTVATLDTSEAASFTFVPLADLDPEAAENYESERNQANLDEQRLVLGADEITDVVVRFTVGGHEFFAFFSVVRYGDAWWIVQLGGNFAQLMAIPTFKVGAAPAELDTDGSSSTTVEP